MDAATMSSIPNNKSTPSGGFSLLNLENRVFCCFLLWTSVLVGKMLLMSMLTALQRFRNKVFPNQEDLFFKNIEVAFNDPHVERVRRAHRNDMENILPYFTMALLYICTDPNPTIACNLFRVASVARIIHTLVYAFRPVPQPSRFLAFFVMFLITIYMAIVVGFENLKYI
ncbi:microsomal glutathione S-transferase 1 [Musca domestica]|uniref:Microsomal glutathione S-transferase 1 n=1 Tax=Musca domestica TaxID=7370 RepID=A0A1I8M9P5_MUSDO|nr:microsomal glutathione S-transferase 1 [Musca domestica]XP_011292172.1 microsomal glutathione S-transferase 1 [Musca domestica]